MTGTQQVVAYPKEVAERYRALGYWTGETLAGLLRTAASARPDGLAVVDGDRSLTYSELDREVEHLAAGLAADGLRPGDRVVVQLPNQAEFLIVINALFRLGVWPIFALPSHRRTEIEYFCRFTEAAALVTCPSHAGFDHAALAGQVAGAVPTLRRVLLSRSGGRESFPTLADLSRPEPAPEVDLHPEQVAFLQLSGGTTGTPKLIPRTHDDYLYSVRESARICGLTSESVLLAALPAAHNFTMSSPGLLGIAHVHGTVVMAPDPSPAAVFELIRRHRVTIVPAVPPLAIAWLNSPARETADLSSLEVIQIGGAKLSRSVAERIAPAFSCTLQQVFGMAEGLVNYTRLDDDRETILSTQGRPISPADEIRIVDDAGQPVPAGTPGHLLTRGPYTIRGYYKAPQHNRRTFTADGFYRTGDVVVSRADGYLTVVGRSKDQINRGGEKVAPEEVEDHLLRHPGIHDVSVVGVPDNILGERVRAYVVGRLDAGPRLRPVDLRRHLAAAGLATHKVPDEFEFVSTLPQTAVGKIDRRSLVEVTP